MGRKRVSERERERESKKVREWVSERERGGLTPPICWGASSWCGVVWCTPTEERLMKRAQRKEGVRALRRQRKTPASVRSAPASARARSWVKWRGERVEKREREREREREIWTSQLIPGSGVRLCAQKHCCVSSSQHMLLFFHSHKTHPIVTLFYTKNLIV